MVWPKDKVFNTGKDFVDWMRKNNASVVKNNINSVHMHHTWSPDHHTKGTALQLHKNMRNYHVKTRGWKDIGQHVTLGVNGEVVLGRNITWSPASAKGYNGSSSRHPFMFETIGNFDKGHDKLEGAQLNTVLAILHYFVVENGKSLKFHREMGPKTCPGTGIDKNALLKEVKEYKAGRAPGSVTTGTSKPVVGKPAGANVGGSIVDYLNSKKIDSSYKHRKKLATEYGVKNYSGTAAQNTELLDKMKAGKKAIPQIEVDGYWGKNTTRRLQEVLGTPVDGIISKQHKNGITTKIEGVTFGNGGSLVVKALQKKLGVTEDGNVGPATLRALQKRYGTPQDGKLSRPSLVVKAMQRALNQGKF